MLLTMMEREMSVGMMDCGMSHIALMGLDPECVRSAKIRLSRHCHSILAMANF